MKSKINSFIILLAILPIIYISCVTKPDTVSDNQSVDNDAANIDAVIEKPLLNVNYDSEVNILFHSGWKVSAPPECTFMSPLSVNRENELLHVNSGDDTLLSLYKYDIDFVPDHNLLVNYIDTELSSNNEVADKGLFDLSGNSEIRKKGNYWSYEGRSVIIEKTGQSYFEWRLKNAVNSRSAESLITERIIREADLIDDNVSGRLRSNGFSFISHSSPWRWRGDIADGFLLECLVPEKSPGLLAVFLSNNKFNENTSWFTEISASPEKTFPVEFSLNGENIISNVLVNDVTDNFGRKHYTRLIIPVEEDHLHDRISIIIYHEVIDGYQIDPVEIFNSDQLQKLLKFCVTLPVNAEEAL